MDEFGSNIGHSDDPSFAMAFLYYVPLGISFSIMWPLKDLEYGGLCELYLPLSVRVQKYKMQYINWNYVQCSSMLWPNITFCKWWSNVHKTTELLSVPPKMPSIFSYYRHLHNNSSDCISVSFNWISRPFYTLKVHRTLPHNHPANTTTFLWPSIWSS